ncbi:MAG: hypothetical protein JXR76_32830 [Deltaproteobacteria bacterium]|nr:hypothetical protein [Deltaproteobacteria bacterium]
MQKITIVLLAISALGTGGCLPYLTQNRQEVLVKHLDVAQTLVIAERELADGGTGSVLTLWAIRDQPIKALEAQKIASLYFKYIDHLDSRFNEWHLTWAMANMYRLGDAEVKKALQQAYDDATSRAPNISRVANLHANGETLYMGDAHAGGRAYAKRHLVAPGNEAYLQSLKDDAYLRHETQNPDPFWGPPGIRDFTPKGWVRQPSFVSHAGILNKNEHAAVLTVDGELLPPAILAGYRYGLFYWWEAGFDVGGDYGVFEALAHMKMEYFKTAKSERFYWGGTYKTGYKHHKVDFKEDVLEFDDRSWIVSLENSFALRFGKTRQKSLYLATQFYIDYDLHAKHRQTDYYVAPALLGWENTIGNHGNFFIHAGMVYAINGMEMPSDRILYEGDWFPIVQFGFGLRSGDKTAIYYAPQTRHMAKR